MNDIVQDLAALTSTITDAQTKPILRSTLALGLRDLGHSPEAADVALDEFFKETKH